MKGACVPPAAAGIRLRCEGFPAENMPVSKRTNQDGESLYVENDCMWLARRERSSFGRQSHMNE